MGKALVIGGSGFIGSHVVDELLSKEYIVINFDTHPYESQTAKYQYQWLQGSMLNYKLISDTICDFKPDVVFNFAGISDIDVCNESPLDAVRKNVLGNQYILQAIADLIASQPFSYEEYEKMEGTREHARCEPPTVPLFIFASSMYVYKFDCGPYAIAKRGCEEWIRWYSKQYAFPHIILRYGTIYGPRAKDNNSIKAIVKHALKDKMISYYGTGEEVREYIHVKDVARCSVEMISSEYTNCALVLSGAVPIKAKDMVAMLEDILGKEYEKEFCGEKPDDHYRVTPYCFSVDEVRKYDIGTHYELAAGLMTIVKEIHSELGRAEK